MSKKRHQRKSLPVAQQKGHPQRRIALAVMTLIVFLTTGVILARQAKNTRRHSGLTPADTSPTNPLKEYVYVGGRLVATEEPSSASSLPAPTNVIANATSTVQVNVSWALVTGAASYIVQRATVVNGTWAQAGTSTTNIFSDTTADPLGLQINTTYLYRVIAVDSSSGQSPPSGFDYATTETFTDEPIQQFQTLVKAVHIQELRTGVNALRVAAGLGQMTSWPTDNILTQQVTTVKAGDIEDLRTNLTPALTQLGKAASYHDEPITSQSTLIRVVHIQELRAYIKGVL